MGSPTPPPPPPDVFDSTGRELTSSEIIAVARAHVAQFGVPVMLVDAARQRLAEGTLLLGQDATTRVASVVFSNGAGVLSPVPIFIPSGSLPATP